MEPKVEGVWMILYWFVLILRKLAKNPCSRVWGGELGTSETISRRPLHIIGQRAPADKKSKTCLKVQVGSGCGSPGARSRLTFGKLNNGRGYLIEHLSVAEITELFMKNDGFPSTARPWTTVRKTCFSHQNSSKCWYGKPSFFIEAPRSVSPGKTLVFHQHCLQRCCGKTKMHP